ncbi:hypothetical protein [Paenibacillus faecis]|nr:hypothetical protein [Paenibacillus faecis]
MREAAGVGLFRPQSRLATTVRYRGPSPGSATVGDGGCIVGREMK